MIKVSKVPAFYSYLRRSFASFTQAKLPDLSYDYGALEPVIAGQIMEIHHKKHHNAYVTGYNTAVQQFLEASEKGDHHKILQLEKLIRFNGGGFVNHSIFWTNLAPVNRGGGELPNNNSQLSKAVTQTFGSYDNLI